jgi:hypothetical protein
MLDELFTAIDSYEVDLVNCRRKYAEFVKGFNSVPIRFTVPPQAPDTAMEAFAR